MSDSYGFAVPDPVGVSSADACTTTMTEEKKAAVKGYLNTLGPELRRRHGKRDHYEPHQVRDTAVYLGLQVDWLCWAYVLYCSPPVFESIHSAAGEVCDRSGMWTAVAGTFFNGNADFDPIAVSDVILSGAVGAADAVGGVADSAGWLADIDWGGLLDWG
jgi:hypothetical protein